jgi:flagellar motor component MotA
MIGPILLFISAGIFLMQSENVGSAITQITALIVALGGIAAVILEFFDRKKESASIKRFTSLFGQKTVENIPRMQKVYDLMKKSGQISPELAKEIETEAKKVEEAARVGTEQLQIIEDTLKPDEKADSLVIPRESRNTKPIPKDPNVTAHIKPKPVAKK